MLADTVRRFFSPSLEWCDDPFSTELAQTYTVLLGSEDKWLNIRQLPNWEVAIQGGY